nr:hypothetical protein [Bacteroidota bacterium]
MGHATDMINRIRYNDSLRKPYRARHERIKEAYKTEFKSSGFELYDRNIPKEELERIRANIRKTLKRESMIAWGKTIILTCIVAVLLGYLLYFLIPFPD